MKVRELADIAGTTVRTVRHYHHVGLLPVPPPAGATRDYGLDHLARVLRVRWLVGTGMSLAAIGETLGAMGPAPGAPGLDELTATLADIDLKMAELTRQRERVAALVERARAGDEVNPLPPAFARLYARMIPRLPTERARRAAENERKVVTILALRGMIPEGLECLADEVGEDDHSDIESMFVAFADLGLEGRDDAAADARAALLRFVDRHEDTVVQILRSAPRGPAGAAMWALLRRLAILGYPAPAQRRFLDAVPELLDERPRLRAAFDGTDLGAPR
ncbi:MerR family transcriptional regulator [Tsukamurella sp. 8F]|uniref:MerR family transcriptional regulator n=1 Tax=unclassified Tsukamurella TaxID=2633480 RepID=UPI0023B9EC21|nr:MULTISPECIES: MerR family transcriptional regulator [unclassified Tsukamurella]MDF0532590.1 MerR family transcriptional regulator [Tsukamurella sp. 8J]MDF0589337.1 MerR family transcriptional regulator [Tsukamurella sp. 8F]